MVETIQEKLNRMRLNPNQLRTKILDLEMDIADMKLELDKATAFREQYEDLILALLEDSKKV